MVKELQLDIKRNEKKFPQIPILFLYRLGNKINYDINNKFLKNLILIPFKILYKFCLGLFGCEIPLQTKIGGGIRLRHLNGIIINSNTVIGENCTIFHQVTIGSLEGKGINGGAIIKDNVYIGAGAKILGNICIENDVKIGANAVVVNDISSKSTVFCKSTIIKR